jgi:hypothetical protein
MTVPTKYIAQMPPTQLSRKFLSDEFRKVQLSTDSIVSILEAVGVPIEIGPADSAGVGFRALRIPN